MKKFIFTLLLISIGIFLSTTLKAQSGNLEKALITQTGKTWFEGHTFHYAPDSHYWNVDNGRIIGPSDQKTVVIERIDYNREMWIIYAGITWSGFYRTAYFKIDKNSDAALSQLYDEFNEYCFWLYKQLQKDGKIGGTAPPTMAW